MPTDRPLFKGTLKDALQGTLIRLSYFTLGLFAILALQVTGTFPNQAGLPPLQQGTNHYQLVLEQVGATPVNRMSLFASVDPLQPKPHAQDALSLQDNLPLAQLLAVKAFLWGVIYYGEGTYSNFTATSPYRLILGEKEFDSYADHPRQLVTVNPGTELEVTSDAAGACQFTSEVWDNLHRLYPHVWYDNLPAFHPNNQDVGCLLLFAEAGGYQRLVKGVSVNSQGEIVVNVNQFMEAVAISCPIWASFPCTDGSGAYTQAAFGYQTAKPIEDLWRNYRIILEAEQSLLPLGLIQ